MSQDNGTDSNTDQILAVTSLPPKALQAIYHAATGKTESIRRKIRKNVIIRDSDIESLYHRLLQEFSLHQQICDPTVTINIHFDEDVSQQYSSWERYKNIKHLNQTVTSSFVIKMEAVIRLPGTPIDQRLVVEVALDSSLPILMADQKKNDERPDFGWMIIDRNIWETVESKIDFVDFVVAKNFVHIIESWAERLPCSDQGKSSNYIISLIPLIGKIGPQAGRVGAGAFLITYSYFADLSNIGGLIFALGLMYILWGAGELLRKLSFDSLIKSSARSKVPSVILLNDLDERNYKSILSNSGPATKASFVKLIITFASSFAINIVASIVYAKYVETLL